MTKPNAVDDAIAFDRRKFIKGVGFAVLTVQCLPLIAHASGHSPSAGNKDADHLVIHSTSGFVPHVHDLLIPYAVLNTPPPQGVELTSTQAFFHTHRMVLTQKQLMAVSQGETVTQKASSHLFVITWAKQQDHIQVG